MNRQLDTDGIGKKSVLTCVVMPDYSHLLANEIKRAELISGYSIMKGVSSRPLAWLVPKSFITDSEYNKNMRKLEFNIDNVLMREVVGSQTAFMALDSLSSVLKLSKIFRYCLSKCRSDILKKLEQGANNFLQTINRPSFDNEDE